LTSIDHTRATVEQRSEFDTIIDARSPAEFAEDHIPGAINCPVLDNEQRIVVGTLYKQSSPFDARKVGAVLVARNVANYIEQYFADKPKGWKPLVYCWRGGQRSGAFTHILREVGWSAKRLQGGYKSWRSHVIEQLDTLAVPLRFTVVAGPTGSAKTRVLEAMHRQGHQVLNLEALAQHKGSVLGGLPGQPQPSQKCLKPWCTPSWPGLTRRAPCLWSLKAKSGPVAGARCGFQGIQTGTWVRVEASMEQRVQYLLRDYDYFLSGPELEQQLDRLKELCGGETVNRWKSLVAARDFQTLVAELLSQHYDRFYNRSMNRHAEAAPHTRFSADDLSDAGIEALARTIAS